VIAGDLNAGMLAAKSFLGKTRLLTRFPANSGGFSRYQLTFLFILAAGNKLPPPLQRFNLSRLGDMQEPPRIMFPPDGAWLEISGQPDPSHSRLPEVAAS